MVMVYSGVQVEIRDLMDCTCNAVCVLPASSLRV